MMVLCVDLEVLGEVVDPLAEERDLNFGRPRVTVVYLVCSNDPGLTFPAQCHWRLLHERPRRDVTGETRHPPSRRMVGVLLLP